MNEVIAKLLGVAMLGLIVALQGCDDARFGAGLSAAMPAAAQQTRHAVTAPE